MKIAVRVDELKTRIKLSFPASYPYARDLAAITAYLVIEVP